MSYIPDDKLFSYSSRVTGKVVIITGAANGIGREAALRFAQYGAKVVIADIDLASAQKLVEEITNAGGKATCAKCDVTKWDEQVSMFEHALKEYGAVDVVIPNAGITELGGFETLTFDKAGRPQQPSLKTMEVNLTAVLFTCHLALHYLSLLPSKPDPNPLKSLILVGSIASWISIPTAPLYTGSKHAVLGVMRSLSRTASLRGAAGVRTGCIHPFFADTAIVPAPMKLMLAGIPFTTPERVAAAMFYAATDEKEETDGASWLVMDEGEVFVVPKEEFKFGVYEMIDKRVNAAKTFAKGLNGWVKFFGDIYHVVGLPLVKAGLAVGLAKVAWDNRTSIENYVGTTLLH